MATNNSFNNNIVNPNSNVIINSGTNALALSADAVDTTVEVGTGTGNKTVRLGSITGTSGVEVQLGSSGFLVGPAPFYIRDNGIMTNVAQPAFYAYQGSNDSNVTGDGTVYKLALDNVSTNQGSYFDNTTYDFTAPVAGLYFFCMAAILTNVGAQTTLQLLIGVNYPTTSYNGSYISPSVKAAGNFLGQNFSLAIPLSANDVVDFRVIVSGGTKTIGVNGVDGQTFASGFLIC